MDEEIDRMILEVLEASARGPQTPAHLRAAQRQVEFLRSQKSG